MRTVIHICFFSILLLSNTTLVAQGREAEYPHNSDETVFTQKDLLGYKKTIATVVKPDFKEFTHKTGKASNYTYYIALVKFTAGNVEVEDDVEDLFLHFYSTAGEQFTVFYDSLHPHIFRVFPNQPHLSNTAKIDTTVGTITSLDGASSILSFSYFDGKVTRTKKQDITYGDFLYNTRPDIVKGRTFSVIFEATNPAKAILLVDKPTDIESHHFSAHNNLIGMNMLPLSKLSFSYGRVIRKKIVVGFTATTYFDPLHEASFYDKISAQRSRRFYYTDSYFEFKNAMCLSADVKWYPLNSAPLGFYLKLQIAFLSAQMKSNFFNKNILKDSTATYFSSLDTSNKVSTTFSTVKSFGLQTTIGCSFFIGNSYKWVMDIGARFRYFFLPANVTLNKTINGVKYYYHDSPAWSNFFNVPVCFQIMIYRKF